MTDPRWCESLELFNKGDFFESHEVLEKLWREALDDPHRNLYKGMIQAAAALYQLKRGRLSGAAELCRSSVRYLEAYAPHALGLDVNGLISGMNRVFEKGDKSTWDESAVFRLSYR